MRKNIIFFSIFLAILFYCFLIVPESVRAEDYIFTPLTKYFLTDSYPSEKVLIKIGIFTRTRQNIDSRIEKKEVLKDWQIHKAFISAFILQGWKKGDIYTADQEVGSGSIEITREKRMNLRGRQKDRVIVFLNVCDKSPLWNRDIYRGKESFSRYTKRIVEKAEDCLKHDNYLR